MKRPFAVTGLSFLSSLAVVFYFYSNTLLVSVSVSAAVLTIVSVIWKLKQKDSAIPVVIIAVCVSVLTAFLSIFLFRNYKVQPVIDKYSNKEIYVQGYCTDTVVNRAKGQSFVLQTESINGEKASVRVYCNSFSEKTVHPYERIEARFTPVAEDSGYELSKRVYLYAVLDNSSGLSSTGGYHTSPLSLIAKLRQRMKQCLNDSLDNDAAALSRAVLLGDKRALPPELRAAFAGTGTSYLIVVSGMHLAIISSLLCLILRSFHVRRRLSFFIITGFVIFFILISGAYPSVIRAGVMLIIIHLGRLFRRDPDGVNSLGTAALFLTLPNPYAVGDVGMLLSFSAVCGILLWADKLADVACRALRLTPTPVPRNISPRLSQRLSKGVKRLLRGAVSFVAVSLAATLWVIPITVIFFGSITPLTVPISLIAYPLTAAVLILSMLLVLFGMFGITAYPLVPIIELLSGWLISFIRRCATLPFCQIEANERFYYIWIAVSVVLAAVGHLIHARRKYVVSAAIISLLTLSIGGSLTYLLADHPATLTVTRNGFGCTAEVRRAENVSLLSCGGTKKGGAALMEGLERFERIDCIVLASGQKRHAAYLEQLAEEWEVADLVVYNKKFDAEDFDADKVHLYGDNTMFTVMLNSDVSVQVMAVRGRVYQYVYSDDTAVLLVPDRGRLSDLPERYLCADAVIFEGKADDSHLLDCGRIIALSENSGIPNAEVLENNKSVRFRF